MFLQGEIVFAPCPNTEGTENIHPHYLVVMGSGPEGVLCMFVTSLKERTGGAYAFTEAERNVAGFAKPCRFDPSRLVLYPPKTAHVLQKKSGRLTRQMTQRLQQAAVSARANYVRYRDVA